MNTSLPKLIFGGGSIIRDDGLFSTPQQVTLSHLHSTQENIHQIDTAQLYGNSDDILGTVNPGAIGMRHIGSLAKCSSSREENYD
ncbi:hypothetical protein BDV27DRAFT_158209 [Aspergillus caelatus]|uniref:NADP-dependent oxidoreductase domain-containing protein n=1 Tax=Aspergillus caelatus TaxID=61420 RepID=A0A5N7A2F9_9EURO|nr:uncharacterized protein BDV27DRAFT_158209 [Aspergillus caelatus]KAE8364064.1 hypothetical protein BDV27DRAFT_158209 [Aspergillus caelatus]